MDYCHSMGIMHEDGPLDPIMGMAERFRVEQNPEKVNLGIGAYRTDEGKPFVLELVRKAEEYAGVTGISVFTKEVVVLTLGEDSPAIVNKRVFSTQRFPGRGVCG